MSWPCRLLARPYLWLLTVLVVPLLVACGLSESEDGEAISWQAVDPATSTPAATPPPVGDVLTDVLAAATPSAPVGDVASAPGDLAAYHPNELGMVPVLEYHVITTDASQEEQFVRTADDMRADLAWLYENNFYVVSMRELITNTISAPAGKRPVVLTFDDGTSGQFRFIKDSAGNLVPDPDSGVGILEAFFAAHPDFGHTAHFAVLPYNCFAVPEADQMQYCDQKITWLAEHGYEVGNHTVTHANLTDLPTETFVEEVVEPMIWIDGLIGDVPENMSDVLTLPYGTVPDKDLHPDQRQLMREGFSYKGETYHLSAALLVGANPTVSPASTEWEPLWIPRIQCFDEELAKWFGHFERDEVPLYVSDGDPNTITVPSPLPGGLEGQLDPAALTAAGKTVQQYDPVSGQLAMIPDAAVARAPRRNEPGVGPI